MDSAPHQIITLARVSVAAALLTVAPQLALAFGQATFQCGGAEFSTTWYGRQQHERDLTFPLTTTTVDGKTYTITRNGKQMQPRAFWLDTPAGLVFTPRFGNEFLFDKGQGVMVKDRSELIDLLRDFGTAVTAGEFDLRIMEVSRGRAARTQSAGARPRGRPRKQA